MLLKIVTLFLIGMAAVALIGRLRWPLGGRPPQKRVERPTICGHCGRFIIGKDGCDCRGKG